MLNVIIIGGGCAGLSAAIYAGRANLSPLVFADDFQYKGGCLGKTTLVENYPGYPEGVLGCDLVDNLEKQALLCGAKILDRRVDKIVPQGDNFTVVSASTEYHCKAIILGYWF